MKYDTISDAAHAWVEQFNRIPQAVIEKLMRLDENEIVEVTPPSESDRICIWSGEYSGETGEIIGTPEDDDDLYLIRLDDDRQEVSVSKSEFDVERDDLLPMWGTMWSFGDSCDDWWLEERDGLQKMADCGFRIYKQEDWGYIFGIDGAGYDFYESHWIPLYKARGLHWHKDEKEAV